MSSKPASTLMLTGPAVILVLSLGFTGMWLFDRSRVHLLACTGAGLLFFCGMCAQIFGVPSGSGPNAIASSLLYTAAVQTAVAGLLGRSGVRWSLLSHATVFASINGAVFWFAAVEPNLGARMCVMNIGYGALFLAASFRLKRLARAGIADRVLFWALTLFAVHFPVRTILTSDARFAQTAAEFSRTPFWTFLHLSLAVFGVGLVLSLLAATVSDMLSRLRRERDHDPLTGLLNRAALESRIPELEGPARLTGG
jgi:hypothetical protein